eukprot:550462_1
MHAKRQIYKPPNKLAIGTLKKDASSFFWQMENFQGSGRLQHTASMMELPSGFADLVDEIDENDIREYEKHLNEDEEHEFDDNNDDEEKKSIKSPPPPPHIINKERSTRQRLDANIQTDFNEEDDYDLFSDSDDDDKASDNDSDHSFDSNESLSSHTMSFDESKWNEIDSSNKSKFDECGIRFEEDEWA